MYTNEQLIEFCQEAVRIPSYSGQEKGVAEFMKRKMEEYGFDEVIIDKYGSVLGTINGKRPGKTILMDGHIDTVDVIDAPQWKHDPFGGEIVDGRIYGRGTSDMKGSDCAMITAAARYAEKTGKDFAGKICVSCTVRKIVPNEHPLLGKGILELTDIISKPYPGASVVPSLCRATFDRRTLVGEDEGVILGQVNEAIARAQEKHPGLKARCYLAEGEEKCWTGETIRAKRYFPAWVVDEDSELVQGAMKGLKDAGIEAKLSHFAFCTNGSSFCGEAGIPCIGYGPSLESLAHVRDEYIEIDQLTKACKGFECILAQLTK